VECVSFMILQRHMTTMMHTKIHTLLSKHELHLSCNQ
jgi:hypothetical protein